MTFFYPYKSFVLVALFLTFAISTEPAQAEKSRGEQILESIDDMWRGDSAIAVAVMKVKTTHYTRTMKMKSWTKGKEKTLMVILSPVKEKGTATLKSGENIYTYLPKTDRTIKLTSGMMSGSWMGSHFTNDDLVKESRRSEDYDIEITFEGKRNDREEIEFTMTPKEDAAVVWGKVVTTVWYDPKNDNYIPIDEISYDEDMVAARTMTFTDLKMLGGKERPVVMTMVPADKPDEYTKFIYESLEFDVEISDTLFSVSRLRKRR